MTPTQETQSVILCRKPTPAASESTYLSKLQTPSPGMEPSAGKVAVPCPPTPWRQQDRGAAHLEPRLTAYDPQWYHIPNPV